MALKQNVGRFVFFPKRDNKIESVVLNRDYVFCRYRCQGFKIISCSLEYVNIGRVTPTPA